MKTKDIALSSLFGIAIFSQKLLLPAPYDKMVSILIQITFLCLAFLIMGFTGPILTGFISGVLTASMRGELWSMTFAFALIYGVFVGSLNRLCRVVESGQVKRGRLMVSSLVSTVLVGSLSAASSIVLGVMPNSPILISTIIVAGAVQGLAGGYVSSMIWKRYLRKI